MAAVVGAAVLITAPAETKVMLRNVVYPDVQQASSALKQLVPKTPNRVGPAPPPSSAPKMLASIVDVSHIGYPLLFLLVMAESSGVPVPGETALIAGAVLASRGQLSIELVIALAAAGAIVGDNIGYLIGRKGGRWLLERPGTLSPPAPARCWRPESRSSNATAPRPCSSGASSSGCACGRRGSPAPRACPGARSPSGTPAAASCWATAIGLIAYFLGQSASNAIQAFGLYGLAAFVLAVGGVLLAHRRHRRQLAPRTSGGSPRARPDARPDAAIAPSGPQQ